MKKTVQKNSFLAFSLIVPTILLIGCGKPESDIRQLERAAQKASTLKELDTLGNPNTKPPLERMILLGRRAQLAANCAIERMSTEAKTLLAKREHTKRMRNIGHDDSLLALEPALSEWHPDIVSPLLRSCDELSTLYDGPAMHHGQEAVKFTIDRDKEYREIMAPFDVEYREAKKNHDEKMMKKKQKEDAERQQREAWLFKNPSNN